MNAGRRSEEATSSIGEVPLLPSGGGINTGPIDYRVVQYMKP